MSFIVFVYRPISYFRACHMLKINRLNINTNENKQVFFVLLKRYISAFKIASYAQFKCFIIFKDDRTY